MSTVKSKKLQVGTDASASNNFTIYQPATPDGTLRIGVGNADSPTEVGRFTSAGYKPATAPVFRAVTQTSTSLSNNNWTKVKYDLEEYDTTGDYDPTTNYRFTPSVAGFYAFYCSLGGLVSLGGNAPIGIWKNGGWSGTGMSVNGYSTAGGMWYMNGTTDYVEVYQYQNSGATQTTQASHGGNLFTGYLIQQA